MERKKGVNQLRVRYFYIIIIAIVIIGIIAVILIFRKKPITKMNVFLNQFSVEQMKEIQIMSGKTGNVIVISDQDQMNTILDYLDTVDAQLNLNTHNSSGWSYRITLYNQNEDKMKVVFAGDNSRINNKRYTLTSSQSINDLMDSIGVRQELNKNQFEKSLLSVIPVTQEQVGKIEIETDQGNNMYSGSDEIQDILEFLSHINVQINSSQVGDDSSYLFTIKIYDPNGIVIHTFSEGQQHNNSKIDGKRYTTECVDSYKNLLDRLNRSE